MYKITIVLFVIICVFSCSSKKLILKSAYEPRNGVIEHMITRSKYYKRFVISVRLDNGLLVEVNRGSASKRKSLKIGKKVKVQKIKKSKMWEILE